ncbi:unnamed protein product [Penicillium olsonii]|nr:unnamed protein product [Penicillium olsonii]
MRIQADIDCDICYQCSDFSHSVAHFHSEIQSIEPALSNAILLAIPLGKNQFDLAVQQKSTAERIREHVTDLTYLRLLSSDPLFTAEFGRSYVETASRGLTHMRGQYNFAASTVFESNDPRIIGWFNSEVGRIDRVLKDLFLQKGVPMV